MEWISCNTATRLTITGGGLDSFIIFFVYFMAKVSLKLCKTVASLHGHLNLLLALAWNNVVVVVVVVVAVVVAVVVVVVAAHSRSRSTPGSTPGSSTV